MTRALTLWSWGHNMDEWIYLRMCAWTLIKETLHHNSNIAHKTLMSEQSVEEWKWRVKVTGHHHPLASANYTTCWHTGVNNLTKTTVQQCPTETQTFKHGFQPYTTHATYVMQATQGFTQRTQHVQHMQCKPFTQWTQCMQRMQEVVNDVAGICHIIWLASN